MIYPSFSQAIADTREAIRRKASIIHTERWQGVDISDKPEMATHELLHHSIHVDMVRMMFNSEGSLRGNFVGVLQQDIKPNMPWAEDHFAERVCGEPINPGVQWAKWPWGNNATKFLEEGKFNHNYMERYWPKWADYAADPTATAEDYKAWVKKAGPLAPNEGIRYEYGDLDDVVNLLCSDPFTRQAYFPVWFPEDTGGGNKRAPCSLGYHFIMRNGKMDVTYYIRSCDYLRHFRDDIYLTARLAFWVIEQCKLKSDRWQDVTPGEFLMHITSLHLFRNDYQQVFGPQPGA
jgi:thymidylate synthase-like protein